MPSLPFPSTLRLTAHRAARAPLAHPPPPPMHRRRPARSLPPPPAATAFRPCIDIHKGVVKQIVGGSLRDLDG